jgi:hypothetical protein
LRSPSRAQLSIVSNWRGVDVSVLWLSFAQQKWAIKAVDKCIWWTYIHRAQLTEQFCVYVFGYTDFNLWADGFLRPQKHKYKLIIHMININVMLKILYGMYTETPFWVYLVRHWNGNICYTFRNLVYFTLFFSPFWYIVHTYIPRKIL